MAEEANTPVAGDENNDSPTTLVGVGIELGTANGRVAVTRLRTTDDTWATEVLANAQGHRETPTTVSWLGGEVEVGRGAERHGSRYNSAVVGDCIPVLGVSDLSSVDSANWPTLREGERENAKTVSFELSPYPSNWTSPLDDTDEGTEEEQEAARDARHAQRLERTPTEVVAEVLKLLSSVAADNLGESFSLRIDVPETKPVVLPQTTPKKVVNNNGGGKKKKGKGKARKKNAQVAHTQAAAANQAAKHAARQRLQTVAVTIAHPEHMGEEQRLALLEACRLANIRAVRLASSAALAVLENLASTDEEQSAIVDAPRVFVVVDAGRALDVSVFRVHGRGPSAVIDRLITKRDEKLGGDEFAEKLVTHFANEFRRKTRLDVNESKRALAKLRSAAETCKITLSKSLQATVSVDTLYEGMDFASNVSRTRFEGMCRSLCDKIMDFIDGVMEEVNVTVDDVSRVIMVGGSSHMPQMRDLIEYMFGPEEEEEDAEGGAGKKEDEEVESIVVCDLPDEVAVRGAALQSVLMRQAHGAPLTSTKYAEVTIGTSPMHDAAAKTPVCTRTVSLRAGGENETRVLIPAGATLPHTRAVDLVVPESARTSTLQVGVYADGDEKPLRLVSLGPAESDAPTGEQTARVAVRVDAAGKLTVHLADPLRPSLGIHEVTSS